MKNATANTMPMPHTVWPTLTRLASIATGGLLATVALLLLMDSLVRTDFVLPPETQPTVKTSVVLDKDDTKLTTEDPLPRPTTEDPPPRPVVAHNAPIERQSNATTIPSPTFTEGPTDGGGGIDRQAMPVVRIAPQYPPRAVTRGIEGFVDLAFDITATGRPTNIRVVYAEPEGMFEREAIRALQQWKYHPRVEDGVALMQHGLATRIRFDLEK